jgi:cell wall-associated NlpC family hydrolase
MESVEDRLQSLVQSAELRERAVFRRTVLLSIIPILIAVVLLAYIGWQVNQSYQQLQQTNAQLDTAGAALQSSQQLLEASRRELATAQAQVQSSQQELKATADQLAQKQRELSEAQAEIQRLQQQIDQINQELDELQQQLRVATALDDSRYTGDLDLVVKDLGSTSEDPNRYDVANDVIVSSRGIPWKLNGTSPEEGFDSPGFAAYILRQYYPNLNIPVNPTQAELRQRLTTVTTPQPGDLVFYQTGYTMFYFRDESAQPFVVGMTPYGVVALQPDFAPIIGYGSY